MLTAELGVPVSIANDADMAAVGEACWGRGWAWPDMGYLTVSTGIGAGIVEERAAAPRRALVGRVGHTVIDWQAWADGRPGTLEELGSGSGLARLARERGLGDLNAREVEEAAARRER